MDKLTVRDFDPSGQRIFLRVDFNVPLEDGKVTDDSRIRASIPTIRYLLSRGARVVLASHLGRPDGKVQDGLRLRPVAERLTLLIRQNVPVTGDALGVGTEDAVKRLRPGEALLLENLRFHPEEEKDDPGFAAKLASYADIYVNDAFGTAHRAHASTVGVAKKGGQVVLRVDVVFAKGVTRGTEYKTLLAEKIPASWHIVDIGKQSQALVASALEPVRTVFWNGPVGVFEIPVFGAGTRSIARLLADKADAGATVVIGGGDSVAAIQQQGLASKMTHISTGGGASLEFLEGRELPGIAVLLDRPKQSGREEAGEGEAVEAAGRKREPSGAKA